MQFDPIVTAHQELAPLVRALIAVLEDQPAPRDFFQRILDGIENAREGADLAGPFMELSTSAFLGFQFDAAATLLLDQTLDRAQQLAQSLAQDGEWLH
ncbi:MAG: hypothetical protein AAF430_13195 [Myxococcota bacterium]